MHLDVAVAAGLMAIQGMVAHANSLQSLAFCGMLGLEGDVVNPLPHRSVVESLHRLSLPQPLSIRAILGVDPTVTETTLSLTPLTHLTELLAAIQSEGRDVKRSDHRLRRRKPSKHEVAASLGWDNLEGETDAKKWLCIAAKWKLPVLMAGPPHP